MRIAAHPIQFTDIYKPLRETDWTREFSVFCIKARSHGMELPITTSNIQQLPATENLLISDNQPEKLLYLYHHITNVVLTLEEPYCCSKYTLNLTEEAFITLKKMLTPNKSVCTFWLPFKHPECCLYMKTIKICILLTYETDDRCAKICSNNH